MSKIIGTSLRSYPSASCVAVDIAVVLVEGEIGDYAAYAGHGDEDWVARFGDKISFEEACVHFPGGQLERNLYRT